MTDSSGVTRVNVCPLPRGASLNTSLPIPFLRSLMLRTCERVSSRWDDENTFVISIREENFELVSQLSPQRCNLFSNVSVFNGFGLADSNSCFDAAKVTVNLIGDAIFFLSDNKVLTFGS